MTRRTAYASSHAPVAGEVAASIASCRNSSCRFLPSVVATVHNGLVHYRRLVVDRLGLVGRLVGGVVGLTLVLHVGHVALNGTRVNFRLTSS